MGLRDIAVPETVGQLPHGLRSEGLRFGQAVF